MKKIVRFLLLALLSFVAGSILSTIILTVLDSYGINSQSYPAMESFVPYLLSFGLWIVIMMSLSKKMHWRTPSYKIKIGKLNFPFILLSLITIEALCFVSEPLLEMIPDVMMDELTGIVTGGFWAMATAVVAAPLLEEFLFRGLFQQNFSRYVGRVWGVVLSAVIFGAVHIIPQQAVGAMLCGLVIAVVYELSGSLSTVIILHAINNGIAYLMMMTLGEGASLSDFYMASFSSYWVVYTVLCLYLLGIGYLAFRRISKMDSPRVTRVELTD